MVTATIVCPGCGGPKSRGARLCRVCRRNAVAVGVTLVAGGAKVDTVSGGLAHLEDARVAQGLEVRLPEPMRLPEPITPGQRAALHAKAQSLAGMRGDPTGKRAVIAAALEHERIRVESLNDLTRAQAGQLLDRLEQLLETESV